MLVAALLCLPFSLAPAPRDGGVAAALAESARDPALANGLAERLTRLGPSALPELFAALAHGPALGHATTEAEEEALLAALAACPREALRVHVRARLAAGADTDERRAFLRALERVATAGELSLVRGAAQAGAESGALESTLTATVAALVGHDASALGPVRHWVLEAPAELEGTLVRGLATSENPEVLETLGELLGYRPALDRVLVPEIGRLLGTAPGPAPRELLAALEELLDADDPGLVREAALALGAGEDHEATAKLVELLGHAHPGVRAGAATALARLTGLGFGASDARWRAWYAAESAWLRGSGHELRQCLRTGSLEEVVQALGEISQHRYRRGDLAVEVALVLQHEDPRARKLACLALGHLGSRAAVAPLETALADRVPGVREAARTALRALGIEPPTTDEELEG